MQSITVSLPTQQGPFNATLYYEHDYSAGSHVLDYLHLIKGGMFFKPIQPFDADAMEEEYWAKLDAFRNQFANDIPGSYDLLVDPPSSSGYHRPYLSAYKVVAPQVQWVYFWKNKPIKADINDLDPLRATVVLADSRCKGNFKKVPPKACQKIIIVDDVFATGATATVIIEKLWAAGIPMTVELSIACPLRIPPDVQGKKLEAITPDDLPQ
jgi:hypothetical protein